MDTNIIPEIIAFLSKYGLLVGLLAIAIAGLTELIKIPIYRAAKKYQASTGVDKSVITWTITLVAQALSVLAAIIIGLAETGWNVGAVDWASISATAVSIYAGSTGFYEIIKKIITAIKAFVSSQKTKAQQAANTVLEEAAKAASTAEAAVASANTSSQAKTALAAETTKAESKEILVTQEKTTSGSSSAESKEAETETKKIW
jgi:hypothetical protein